MNTTLSEKLLSGVCFGKRNCSYADRASRAVGQLCLHGVSGRMLHSRIRQLKCITSDVSPSAYRAVSSTTALNRMSCPTSHQLKATAADKQISHLTSQILSLFIQDAGVARVCRCDMSGDCLPLMHDLGAGAQLLQLCHHHHQWSGSHPNSQRRSVPVCSPK